MYFDKSHLRSESNTRQTWISFWQGVVSVFTSLKRLICTVIYFLILAVVYHIRFNIKGFDGPFPEMMHDLTLLAYLVVSGLVTVIYFVLLGTEKNAFEYNKALTRTGFVNSAGEAPVLKKQSPSQSDDRISEMVFESDIPLEEWNDKTPALNSALNVNIVKVSQGADNQHVQVSCVPANVQLPEKISWKKALFSPSDFVLVLGESYLGPVKVNLNSIPHMLIGGGTGSGKTILLRSLLMQAIVKEAEVIIADFKGVDFSSVWQSSAEIIIDQDTLIERLKGVLEELDRRKCLFRRRECSDLFTYNCICRDSRMPRIIIGCDEVSELLDKTGADKEQKEKIAEIESALSTIARQGRAFGIHLILATQRPDANILSGQIKNNLDCKVCGRSDKVLSQIILDSSDAADMIPKDSHGRFLMNDGTLFQGYYFDDTELEDLLSNADRIRKEYELVYQPKKRK